MPYPVSKNPVERICCIPICNNEKFTLTHKFPQNEKRCKDWLAAIDCPFLFLVPKHKLFRSFFVCTRHFRDEDYKYVKSRHLNITAVPSLNLKNLNDLHLVKSRWNKPFEKDFLLINDKNDIIQYGNNQTESDATLHKKIEENESNNINQIIDPPTSQSMKSNVHNVENLNRTLLKRKLKPINAESNISLNQNVPKKFIEIKESIKTYENERSKTINNEEYVMDKTKNGKEYTPTLCIDHPDYEETIELNVFWLRDHCKCDLCYNHETFQRKINILEIPLDITLIETSFEKEGKILIKWSDGHESEYDLEFLYGSQYKKHVMSNLIEYYLWNKSKIENISRENYEVDFGKFLIDDNLAKNVVGSLVKFGFAFIHNVPPTTDMTEITIKRLFPIQKTLFGEMWTFTSNKDRADTAYTTDYLGPHNDNTYFCDAAGLQVFHCIKFKGSGGNSFFVDGFNAIEQLRIEDRQSVEILSKINVPAEYIDEGQYHKHSAPIIQFDSITKQPKQIRFNLYDRSDFTGIELNMITPFYKSLRKLTEILNDESNIFKFSLKPGTVVIFDNWRVLHGRENFSGERVMTGCYVAKTDFMSKARLFGFIQ